MKKTDLINIFLIPVIIISCAGTQTNETKEPVSHIKAESDSIIKTIKEFNSKSPSTVSSSIQVDAVIKNKKYKSSGTAVFDSDSAGINIVLQDYVFKSPIFQLFQEGSKLYIYFPAEKQLIIDNSEVSNLGSYSEIEIDYAVLRSLGRGEIPLIKNYKIKQAVSNPEKKENIIILENDSFYQTIYLADKLPLKMLFANKKTNERIEIYFNKIYNDASASIFQKVKIISVEKKITIDIIFSNIILNKPVKIKSFSALNLKPDVKKTILNN